MGYSHDEWTLLIIHEKMAGNSDAQSHDQKIEIKSKIIANKTPPGLMIVGGGGVKIFTFLFGNRL